MSLHDFVGYLGSLLMFSTFLMRTMVPLRVAAIAANLAMITYALVTGMYAILLLQSIMLPVNIYRLVEIRRLVVRVAEAMGNSFRPSSLVPFMTKEQHADGDVLFKVGDSSERMYLIRSGTVRLTEIDRELGVGEIFGEIGLISPENQRTATAICQGETELMSINREQVLYLFMQQPEFGFYLMRLITGRLMDNVSRAESIES